MSTRLGIVLFYSALHFRCHALRVNHASEIQFEQQTDVSSIIWMKGFGRTMSSTTEQILRNGLSDEDFALYEPCTRDKYDGIKNCEIGPCPAKARDRQIQCMKDVMMCNFSKMKGKVYIEVTANQANHSSTTWKKIVMANRDAQCLNSRHRLFKTINPYLHESLPVLFTNPKLQIVYIERDPRSIYTSQQKTWFGGAHNKKNLRDICSIAAANLKVAHPRLHKIKFHDLVSNPLASYQDLMNRLQLPMLEEQTKFIEANFDNEDCEETPNGTCRKNSKQGLKKWETFLDSEEKSMYDASEDCQTVDRFFGYSQPYSF